MNRRSASTLALTLTTLFASVCFAQGAAEGSKETSRAEVEQCVAQHDSARQLRLVEQWQSARAAMRQLRRRALPVGDRSRLPRLAR